MKEFDHRSRLAENFEEKTYLKSSTIDEDSVDTAHFDNTYDSDLKKEDENIWEESEIELKSLLTANCKPEMLENDPLASSNLYVVKKEKEKPVIRENGLHICRICFKGFEKQASFRNHYRKHGKNLRQQFLSPYEAKKTIKAMRDKMKCIPEKKMSKSVHTFNCIQCSQKFSSVYRLKKHLQAEHISEYPRRTIKDIRPIQIDDFGGEYECLYCPCSYKHKGDKRRHEVLCHSGETPFVCDLCYCSFSQDIFLKHHISKFHRQVSINLRQISLEKADTFMANSDQSSPGTNAPKSSRNGSTSFSIDHSELNSNLLLQKTPKQRISRVKVKNQPSSANESPDLRSNVRKPKVIIVYADETFCSYCPKAFNSKIRKELHERIHNGDTPHPCRYCAVSFRMPAMLVYHMKKCHPGKPYTTKSIWNCDFCKASFSTKEKMENHRVCIHKRNRSFDTRSSKNDSKYFFCDICQSSFRRKDTLAFHRKTHATTSPILILKHRKRESYFSHDDISKEKPYDGDMNSVPSSSHEIIENLAEQEVSDENSVSSSDEIIEKLIKQEVSDEVCQEKQVGYEREWEKIPECELDHDEQLWSQFVILDDD